MPKGCAPSRPDVRFATRYLIDRDIRGGCEIRGSWQPGETLSRIYDDPALHPAEVAIAPSVLSFDIETDATAKRLLAIALYGRFGTTDGATTVDEVYIVDGTGRAMPEHAIGCGSEKQALDAFAKRVQELDPDVLTGWNVVDFDLSVLGRTAKRVGSVLRLGRDDGTLRVRPAQGLFRQRAGLRFPAGWCSTAWTSCAARSSASTTIPWTASPAPCSAKARWRWGAAAGDRAQAILERYRDDLPTFAE